MKISNFLKEILNNTSDFVFPRVCIISGNKIQKKNSNPYIQDEILNSLQKLELKDESLLKKKINHPFAFSLYIFHLDSDVQKFVHSIKYEGFKNLGIFAGEILGKELLLKNFNSLKEYDFILPVPLHPSKLRERGYNQSDLISEGLSRVIGIPLKNDIIKRIKNTKSQTRLDINQRKKNVENAFRISKKYYGFLKNQNVILLDDVITTGSTIKEILNVILRANAKNVFVVSLAHTQESEFL